jgi:hypothetical protein
MIKTIDASAATTTPPAIHRIVRCCLARGLESVDESGVATPILGGARDGSRTSCSRDEDPASGDSLIESGGASAGAASPEIARPSVSAASFTPWKRSAGSSAHAFANQASSAAGSAGTTLVIRGRVV